MYKEIKPFDYTNVVLEKMVPGIFLNTMHENKKNTMIIGWGGINVVWGKPVFIVLVRDCRATYDLIEASNEFTVSIPIHNKMLREISICGSKSLRDLDKFSECGFTTIKGRSIETPIIKEADLHFECKVIYKQKLDQEAISLLVKNRYYGPNNSSYHTVYYGEILDQYLYEKENK